MPKTNGAGRSWVTVDKQEGFRFVMAEHLAVTHAVIARNHSWASQTYQYVDANAGPGIYEDGSLGSPLIFLEVSACSPMRYAAHLIETDPTYASLLRSQIQSDPNIIVYNKDNRVVVGELAETKIPSNSFGLIYHDPNGQPDSDLMKIIGDSHQFKMIDVLIRYNATAVKRNLHRAQLRLSDYLALTGKRHWLIRTVLPGDAWYWTFLLGTNYKDFKPWTSKGFVKLESQDGTALFERLNYAERERIERCQLHLFEDSQTTEPIKNTSQLQNSKLSEAG